MLNQDFKEFIQFLNDNQVHYLEELFFREGEVKNIEKTLETASEEEKIELETELEDTKEAVKLLKDTLPLQYEYLKRRQEILTKHVNILNRRQGVV